MAAPGTAGPALVVEPDILLLDEPTNHLDVPAIAWLEEALGAFRESMLFVSHDRRFFIGACLPELWSWIAAACRFGGVV